MFGFILIAVGVLLLLLMLLKAAGLFYKVTYHMLPRTRLIISLLVFGLSIICILVGVRLL